MFNLDQLVTLEEAAQKLHVSVSTVRRWRYLRTISCTRIGRRLYIDVGAIEKLLEANASGALSSGASRSTPSQGDKEVLGKENNS